MKKLLAYFVVFNFFVSISEASQRGNELMSGRHKAGDTERGIDCFYKKDFKNAMPLLKRANSAEAKYILGKFYFENGEISEALKYLEQTVKLKKEFKVGNEINLAYSILGEIYLKGDPKSNVQQNIRLAVSCLNNAADNTVGLRVSKAAVLLGDHYSRNNQIETASKYYEYVLLNCPKELGDKEVNKQIYERYYGFFHKLPGLKYEIPNLSSPESSELSPDEWIRAVSFLFLNYKIEQRSFSEVTPFSQLSAILLRGVLEKPEYENVKSALLIELAKFKVERWCLITDDTPVERNIQSLITLLKDSKELNAAACDKTRGELLHKALTDLYENFCRYNTEAEELIKLSTEICNEIENLTDSTRMGIANAMIEVLGKDIEGNSKLLINDRTKICTVDDVPEQLNTMYKLLTIMQSLAKIEQAGADEKAFHDEILKNAILKLIDDGEYDKAIELCKGNENNMNLLEECVSREYNRANETIDNQYTTATPEEFLAYIRKGSLINNASDDFIVVAGQGRNSEAKICKRTDNISCTDVETAYETIINIEKHFKKPSKK